MSGIAATTSMFVTAQAQNRARTMSTHALKQQASQERSIADMLAAAAQATQPAGAPPPGQGLAIDIRA